MHKEELRLQMDVAIGKHPPLTDDQMQGRLRKEAHHLHDVTHFTLPMCTLFCSSPALVALVCASVLLLKFSEVLFVM